MLTLCVHKITYTVAKAHSNNIGYPSNGTKSATYPHEGLSDFKVELALYSHNLLCMATLVLSFPPPPPPPPCIPPPPPPPPSPLCYREHTYTTPMTPSPLSRSLSLSLPLPLSPSLSHCTMHRLSVAYKKPQRVTTCPRTITSQHKLGANTQAPPPGLILSLVCWGSSSPTHPPCPLTTPPHCVRKTGSFHVKSE